RQRRARGTERGAASLLRQRAVAALPVSPAAQRDAARAPRRTQARGRGRRAKRARRSRSAGGRGTTQTGRPQVREVGAEAGRLAGDERARKLDRAATAACAPAPPAN